jgi:hypothetical protein
MIELPQGPSVRVRKGFQEPFPRQDSLRTGGTGLTGWNGAGPMSVFPSCSSRRSCLLIKNLF